VFPLPVFKGKQNLSVVILCSIFEGDSAGLRKLSMKNVKKVFIIAKSLFTITKSVKIACYHKIVNLKPV